LLFIPKGLASKVIGLLPYYDIIRREAIPRLVPQAYRRFDLSGGGSPIFLYPSEKGSPRERDPALRIIFPPAINIGRLYIN
jgi:hypothetical protein